MVYSPYHAVGPPDMHVLLTNHLLTSQVTEISQITIAYLTQ